MTYEEKIIKLKSLNKFINGNNQEDILLLLDKEYKKDDKWSIICAVMDWFKVVESYIDSSRILKEKTPDYNWGNVYLYICAVDIITKGINDLYKIITNDNKKLFDGENDVFNSKENDDNRYFQNIRAIFGAHPTDLKENGPYIVATFPTPYEPTIDVLRGEIKDWDYYTLLWSKEKNGDLNQKSFGFSFSSVDKYLDKYIYYLEEFYSNIIKKIQEYKKEMSNKPINKIIDLKKQIRLLIIKDKERFNSKYEYELEIINTLLNVNITDEQNKKIYEKYLKKVEKIIPKIRDVMQNPDKYDNIEFVECIIDCDIETFDNMTTYYYSKLMDYENNRNIDSLLINYFRNKLAPFNNNVSTIEELYCLVKAHNFFRNYKKET